MPCSGYSRLQRRWSGDALGHLARCCDHPADDPRDPPAHGSPLRRQSRPPLATRRKAQGLFGGGVPVVSFFLGDPSPYIPVSHVAASLVMQTAGSAAGAMRMRDAGVDILVAQGWEAGGHVWSQVATLPLVPRVVDAVAPAPVVAAGGVADGRGIAAGLALGAAAAWVGTRVLASQEAQ